MYQTILTEVKAQVLHITINREDKLNALNIQTLADIKNAILNTYDDASVRGIIITGAGKKSICCRC